MHIFLDIDGVMVPARSWEKPALLSDGFMAFSPSAVKVLQQILKLQVTIVLTSSHRGRFTIDEWKAIFKTRGLEVRKIQINHQMQESLSRKEEVLHWLSQIKGTEAFIVIDDDTSLRTILPSLREKVIMTKPTIGLTLSHLPEIRKKAGIFASTLR